MLCKVRGCKLPRMPSRLTRQNYERTTEGQRTEMATLSTLRLVVDGYNNNLQQSSVSHGHGFTMSSQATNALETTTDNTSYKSF